MKTKTMTLRNVPLPVARALDDRARRNGRSIQRELLDIVTQSVVDRASWLAQIDDFRSRYVRRGLTLEQIHGAIDDGRP